ncbi:MAG TPA: RHS repeat-associated core domain-containing protein [Candidatus Sulfotelmatobacter sp.]|nr:RHS repeat-associated core domain-containing protein [Candidatus Sulfotelmatobacter sp.]
MKRICLVLLFAVALLPATAIAQVQTGTPPFGSFGGGPDVINLANLNSNITIPVVNKAGRGMNFTYDLIYDSSVWAPVNSGSTIAWVPAGNWGWNTTLPQLGYLSYTTTITTGTCTLGGRPHRTVTTLHYWTYHDGTGPHFFPGASGFFSSGCGGSTTYAFTGQAANDGSGYSLSASDTTFQSLFDSHGDSINLRVNSTSGAATIVDRNGNEISVSSTGVYTDTLGTTGLSISGAIPTVAYSYTNPAGGQSSYLVKYITRTVQTNFGCSGVAEYGPTSQSLITEIDLPDQASVPGDKYTFTYEQTPGDPNNVTGRLASVTLPTGGQISYSYGGGNNGITCADGSTATLTRTTPDGTWNYDHSESGNAWTTTATDPQSNHTVLNFQGIYETERQVYEGSISPANLLTTVVSCYNGHTSNCNTAFFELPISQRTSFVTLPGNLESESNIFYNSSSGFTIEDDESDYGIGTVGSPLKKTLISYAFFNEPSTITVQDGSGHTVKQTTYFYDQTGVTPTSGTPQHIAVSGSRGNATSVSSLVQGSTSLTKNFTYFDTGNVQTATDVNGAPTTFTYGACGNSFATSVSEPLSLSKAMTWDCTGGVETSATDENSKTVSTIYNDPYFWRPATGTDQLGDQTNFTYANPNSVESSLLFNSSTSTTDILTTLDGLGRTLVTQRKQSPGSSNYDSVETDYDSLGRPSKVTVPYSGTAGQGGGSAPATNTTYDALSRPAVTTDGGNGTVTLSYSGNDVLQTVGPAPTGENTKRRQSEYNSIGQLTSVCEVTGLTGSGSCAQSTSATGYWTKYSYDAAGRLLTVTQNAQSTSQVQTRSYTFDDLGRMTSETNPETGTIAYVYDSNATCGTSNGDLVKKTDAAGNVSCYAYDSLHRRTSITYPSGPNSANTPIKHFVYDSATVNSVVMANAKARLAEAYTCVSPCTSKITDEGFSYTARGEVSDVYESTPHSGGYYHASASYWVNGVLQNLNAPAFGMSYAVDGEGRVYSAGGGSSLGSTTYNAASRPLTVTFGSGDSDSFVYDPNTFRMTQYKYNVNGQSVVGNLNWNANGTLQSLNITDPFDAANTQNCAYTHDDLTRIASGNCGSIWSQTFTYDAFGNITKTGSSQFQPGYNWQTNQMSTGASYDANGDVLSDGLHSYAWDAETRPTTIDTVTATYDALGRMVEQNKSGSYTEIEYAPTGFKLQLMNGQAYVEQFVPMPAGTAEVFEGSGTGKPDYYRHADWLGSSRFASTTSRTMYNDLAYAPFGEQYAQAGSTGVTDTSFAGNNEDTTINLYDAQFREYGIQGRWPSPDPAGMAGVKPANPQTWNRYAYVVNNPTDLNDPTGLQMACRNAHSYSCLVANGGGGPVFSDNCTLDGVSVPCDVAATLLGMGAAVQCPNNECMSTDSNGNITQFECNAEKCGYSGFVQERFIIISITGHFPPGVPVTQAQLQTTLVLDVTYSLDLLTNQETQFVNTPWDVLESDYNIFQLSDQLDQKFSNPISPCEAGDLMAVEAGFFAFGAEEVGPFLAGPALGVAGKDVVTNGCH